MIPVVNVDVVYNYNITGVIIVLSIRYDIYFKGVNQNIIIPFMMRLDGLEVDLCPKFLACNPTMRQNSILLPDLQLQLTTRINGIISYLYTRIQDAGEVGK